MNRETVNCRVCGAAAGEPCYFDGQPPGTVVENGVERRAVHAARYARTLPQGERAAFWETAVERYLAERLAALPAE